MDGGEREAMCGRLCGYGRAERCRKCVWAMGKGLPSVGCQPQSQSTSPVGLHPEKRLMGFLMEAIPKVHEGPTKPYEAWVSGYLRKLTVTMDHLAKQRYGLTKSASPPKVWIRMTASLKKA